MNSYMEINDKLQDHECSCTSHIMIMNINLDDN